MSQPSAPQRRLRAASLLGLIVALALTLVGASGLLQATEEFLDWFESGKLAHAEALIGRAELREDAMELATRYELVVSYDVSWNGTLTKANRVTKHPWFTFDKRVARARLKELTDARDSNQPVTCYLDPNAPEQAVLFLDFPYPAMGVAMILGASFAPIGIWFGLRVWASQNRSWQLAALQYRLPHQPWVRDPARFEGRCPVQRRWPFVIAVCLAWNIPTCCLSLATQLGLDTQVPLVGILTGPALLVGLMIFGITMVTFWILGKYGEPVLVVRPWPLMVGDRLECTLRFTEKVSFKGPLTVNLELPQDLLTAEGLQKESIEPIEVIVENDVAKWSIPSPWRVAQPAPFDPENYHIANWQIRILDRSKFWGFGQIYDVLAYHCLSPAEVAQQQATEGSPSSGTEHAS